MARLYWAARSSSHSAEVNFSRFFMCFSFSYHRCRSVTVNCVLTPSKGMPSKACQLATGEHSEPNLQAGWMCGF